MGILEVAYILVFFWGSLALIDKLFQSMYHHQWDAFLAKYGITLSLGGVWWQTTSLNRLFRYLGRKYSFSLSYWFGVGVIFGAASLFLSVLLLITNLINNFTMVSEETILTPVIPGVNVPSNQLIFYFIALLVSGVFHEFGHALAAVRENISISNFGMFLFVLYPGAFVDFKDGFLVPVNTNTTPGIMDEEADRIHAQSNKRSASTIQQLKVYCAGAWHNAMLAAFAALIMYLFPIVLWPFFASTGGPVLVTNVSQESALFGHLQTGDMITALADCELTQGRTSWKQCLEYMMTDSYYNQTFYLPKDSISSLIVDTEECCEEANLASHPSQCFEWISTQAVQNVCVSARAVVEQSPRFCIEGDSDCLRPVVLPGEVYIKLTTNRKVFVFLGHPISLWNTVEIAEYTPRFFARFFFSEQTPHFLEQMLRYLASISGALALLNMVPAYYLDGQHACEAFLKLVLQWKKAQRQQACKWIFGFTSVLLIANILVAIWSVF